MEIVLDRDVQAVLEFMQRTIPCEKLVAVGRSVAQLAPGFWGHYKGEDVTPISLSETTIFCLEHRPAVATLSEATSSDAGGGFVVGMDRAR